MFNYYHNIIKEGPKNFQIEETTDDIKLEYASGITNAKPKYQP